MFLYFLYNRNGIFYSLIRKNHLQLLPIYLEIFMFNLLLKLLFMITLLIAVVGQSMSVDFMVLHSDISKVQSTAQLHVPDYQSEDVKTPEHKNVPAEVDCCDVECCEDECICPLNACASLVYLDSHLLQSKLMALNESLLPFMIKETHFIATSRYRPPILIS